MIRFRHKNIYKPLIFITLMLGVGLLVYYVPPLLKDSGQIDQKPIRSSNLSLLNSWQTDCPLSDGFDFPVGSPNAEGYYNAQGFGGRNHHLGDDWNGLGGGNSDMGDSVYSVANGIVVFAWNIGSGWGNIVRVLHNTGSKDKPVHVESFYAHLKDIFVHPGQRIRRGQKIATIGNAEGVYLAHLHFEMRHRVNMPVGGGYGKDTSGYLRPSRFIMTHRPQIRRVAKGSIQRIRKNGVRLRSKPHTKSRVIQRLKGNSWVTVLSSGRYQRIGLMGVHTWYHVKTRKVEGWVYGYYLSNQQ